MTDNINKTKKITKILQEFPATQVSIIDGRPNLTKVMFVLYGEQINNNFFKYWTSFITLFAKHNIPIEIHCIISDDINLANSRNSLYSSELENQNYSIYDYLENCEFVFYLYKGLKYFNPADIYRFVLKIKNNDIDILSYGKNLKDNINKLDFKFCIIKTNVFEKLQYPFFESNEFIDNIMNQKINEVNFKIEFDTNVIIE